MQLSDSSGITSRTDNSSGRKGRCNSTSDGTSRPDTEVEQADRRVDKAAGGADRLKNAEEGSSRPDNTRGDADNRPDNTGTSGPLLVPTFLPGQPELEQVLLLLSLDLRTLQEGRRDAQPHDGDRCRGDKRPSELGCGGRRGRGGVHKEREGKGE